MKRNILSTIIMMVALPSIFCNHANIEKSAISNLDTFVVEEIKQSPPTLEIEMPSYLVLEKTLKITLWIRNDENQPIYFYSALLNNRGYVPVSINSEKKMIDVIFTRFHTFEASPNDFPKAEFIKVEPHEIYKKEFITEPFKKQDSYDSEMGYKTQEIKTGIWQIRAAVGYGEEIDSVQRKIGEVNRIGKEHPINPVVKWQKTLYSDYTPIIIK